MCLYSSTLDCASRRILNPVGINRHLEELSKQNALFEAHRVAQGENLGQVGELIQKQRDSLYECRHNMMLVDFFIFHAR